jgi:hypothetical protein
VKNRLNRKRNEQLPSAGPASHQAFLVELAGCGVLLLCNLHTCRMSETGQESQSEEGRYDKFLHHCRKRVVSQGAEQVRTLSSNSVFGSFQLGRARPVVTDAVHCSDVSRHHR